MTAPTPIEMNCPVVPSAAVVIVPLEVGTPRGALIDSTTAPPREYCGTPTCAGADAGSAKTQETTTSAVNRRARSACIEQICGARRVTPSGARSRLRRCYENMATTLVVPCFNEASRLDTDTFLSFAEATDASFVFVDDGSRDDTFAMLQRMADAHPTSITALRLERNQGKAEAVRFGMATAQEGPSEFVGFWDADLATPLSELEALLEHFKEADRLQMVAGSRVLLMGRRIDRKPIRHYTGRVFATVVSIILGLPIYDTQCGAKVFRNNKITRQLFGDAFVSRWIFDVELVARLAQAVGARDATTMASYLVEHPLMTWTDVPGGKLKLGDFAKSAVDLARIYKRYLR